MSHKARLQIIVDGHTHIDAQVDTVKLIHRAPSEGESEFTVQLTAKGEYVELEPMPKRD